jgi:hypothetical protein
MGGPGHGHLLRGEAQRELSRKTYVEAGVGIKPDWVVAKALGVTTNAVHQHRSRQGISRPVCEAITVIIPEPKAGFHVMWHRGTRCRMIRVLPLTREITMTRFTLECKLGRELRCDEIARGGKVTRGVTTGFHLMWAKEA